MARRKFSTAERERLEAEGHTGYGTSYPMPDCDAVRRAVDSYGRAPEAERPHLRQRIMAEAARLHCTDLIPDDWEL